MTRRLTWMAIAASALAAVSCQRVERVTPVSAAETPSVSVAKVRRADLSRDLVLTGELVPYQEIEVMAKVAGYVRKIRVDVGDAVRQGEVLATLEIPELVDDLKKADAAILRAKADLERATREVERARKAYQIAHLTYSRLDSVMKSQPNLVAQQEVDDALARDQIAEAQVAAASSSLDGAREELKMHEAEKGKAETLLRYSFVTAPFDGVITKRYANNGSMIQAGVSSQSQAMPLVTLSQNSRLRLVLDVPESAVGIVKAGSAVSVRVPSLDREFSGKVARISDRVSTGTRTMHTEVDVPNPKGELIPGMYAEVAIHLQNRPGALAIPLSALQRESQGASVWALNQRNQLERRRVRTGIESASKIEILEGLREGENVVLSGGSRLRAGLMVNPKFAVVVGGA